MNEGSLLSKIAGPLMKVAVPSAKKYFSSIRNNSCCFSNWCRNSKKKTQQNAWFWTNNFNNFKQRNEWMNDIMKIVQAPEDSNILLEGVTKTTENETKEQKGGFWEMSLDTLGASLLGKMLTGKGILRTGYGKRMFRADYGSKMDF